MVTMITHLQKALRHRVPMICFRYGLNRTDETSSTQISTEDKTETNIDKTLASSVTSKNELQSTQNSVIFAFFETPEKYRRRPLTQDEIDLIAIGGLK